MKPNEVVFLEGQRNKLKHRQVISFCDSMQGLLDCEEKKCFVILGVFTAAWMTTPFVWTMALRHWIIGSGHIEGKMPISSKV
jgi:hypothetical protein